MKNSTWSNSVEIPSSQIDWAQDWADKASRDLAMEIDKTIITNMVKTIICNEKLKCEKYKTCTILCNRFNVMKELIEL